MRNGQTRTGDLDRHPVAGVEANGDAVVVHLVGELDLYNAHEVRDALTEICADEPARLVVDLSGVEFMDSTALAALVEAKAKLPDRSGFLLAAPGLEARRALETSGLDRHFSVHKSLNEALAAKL